MKKILVPTDFSDLSAGAAKRACEFADKFQGEVHILHMVDETLPINESPYDVTRALLRDAQEDMEKFIADHSLKVFGHEVRAGKFSTGLKEFIKQGDFDLVCMASHGAKGLEEIFLGSNAATVARVSPVPVLVFKHFDKPWKVKRIGFAGDFENHLTLDVAPMLEWKNAFKAAVELVNVVSPDRMWMEDELIKNMVEFSRFHQLGVEAFHVVERHNIVDGLKEFVANNQIDLLVLATHQRKGLKRLFTTSVTEKVVNYMDIPVLSFRLRDIRKLALA